MITPEQFKPATFQSEDTSKSSPPDETLDTATKSYEKIVSAISGVLIVLLGCFGGFWLYANHEQLISGFKNATRSRSLGEHLTGMTWEEKKATGTIGPLDGPLWPESKNDLPQRIELPKAPIFIAPDFSGGWPESD